MKISQSLIKEVKKKDHCPKQIYYRFLEGKEIEDIPSGWKMGRYFESELLGACRGGEVEEAQYKTINLKPSKSASKSEKVKFLQNRGHDVTGLTVPKLDEKLQFEPAEYVKGDKLTPYKDCDVLVDFAKETLSKLGLDLSKGLSQLDVKTDLLSGAIDHRNFDIQNPDILANYDVKYSETKEDDRWNGWANPEDKFDAITQAAHYTLVSYEETGFWMPFYFLVFGVSKSQNKIKWVKIIRYQFTEDSINKHKADILFTSEAIREYAENDYKGKGTFNKCNNCPFNEICEDRVTVPEIEIYQV